MKMQVMEAYFFRLGVEWHCRNGVVIPFWLEWNEVIPFLEEWSA